MSRCSTSWSTRSLTVFPRALVQWEDFASANAFDGARTDIGDACCRSTTTSRAPAPSSSRASERAAPASGAPLEDARVVFFGAGASGRGIGARRASRDARGRRAAGELGATRPLPRLERAHRRAIAPGSTAPKREIGGRPGARRRVACAARGDCFTLADVVRQFKPTVLVGVSGQPGAFTEAIMRDLAAGCPRPIVLALSNPDYEDRSDAQRISSAGPTAPRSSARAARSRRSSIGGRTHTIGQGNNAFIFPGVGLGATAVEARWLPDEAFVAAARALVDATAASPRAGRPDLPTALASFVRCHATSPSRSAPPSSMPAPRQSFRARRSNAA